MCHSFCRRLLRWLAPVILAWACCLPVAWGQLGGPAPGKPPTPVPGQPGGPPSGGSLYIFEHILALVGIGAALIVVCLPSRKRF